MEGVLDPGGESYIQCKCSDCEMHYESKNLKSNNLKYNMVELASKSFFQTFNRKPRNISITKIKSNNYAKANVLTVYYKDDNGNESTFIILNNNKYKSLYYNGQQHLVEKDHYIIDCFGSCDCRERFYPKDGSIECTCSPCKMEVKKL